MPYSLIMNLIAQFYKFLVLVIDVFEPSSSPIQPFQVFFSSDFNGSTKFVSDFS